MKINERQQAIVKQWILGHYESENNNYRSEMKLSDAVEMFKEVCGVQYIKLNITPGEVAEMVENFIDELLEDNKLEEMSNRRMYRKVKAA